MLIESSRRATLCQFRRDIYQLSNIDGPFFLVGDLIARHRKWNCTRANKPGKILQPGWINDLYCQEKIDNAIAQIIETIKAAAEGIPDDLKLLIRPRNLRRRQFIRRWDPLMVSHLNNVIRTRSAAYRYSYSLNRC